MNEEPIIREMREKLNGSPQLWYTIDILWPSGRSERYTTDLATVADCYLVAYRTPKYGIRPSRILVTISDREPPEETRKRQAWDAYLEGSNA
jgi:hypothetical protein